MADLRTAAELKQDIESAEQEALKLERDAAARRRAASRMQTMLERREQIEAASAMFRARGGSLLMGLPDEVLLAVACAMESAIDLARLSQTCRRFGFSRIVALEEESGVLLAEEAARRWLTRCDEHERRWVPRRGQESYVGLMCEVQALRQPLSFYRAHSTVALTENGELATLTSDYDNGCAKCKPVMRAGRHFAQFTIVQGYMSFIGVVRPSFDVVLHSDFGGGEFTGEYCAYLAYNGQRYPGISNADRSWEGMQDAREQGDLRNDDPRGLQTAGVVGDRIGLLLDLDMGSMTVFKNDVRLGLIQPDGLHGEYCWATSYEEFGTSVRIASAAIPLNANAV